MLEKLKWCRTCFESESLKYFAEKTKYLRPIQRFPKGCCQITSILMARFLIEQCEFSHDDVFIVVGGHLPNDRTVSHAWIIGRSKIIDLTADQFAGMQEKVIWARESSFHRKFVGCSRITYKEKIDSFDRDVRDEYDSAYEKLFESITP